MDDGNFITSLFNRNQQYAPPIVISVEIYITSAQMINILLHLLLFLLPLSSASTSLLFRTRLQTDYMVYQSHR